MSTDDASWRQQAREHVAEGRLDLAWPLYAEHVESSRNDPSQAAVRLSIWLSEWADLARVHPPALEALRALRSSAIDRLLAAGRSSVPDFGVLDDFAEVAAVSTRIGEPGVPAEVFARLHEQAPAVAERCATEARRHLVRAGSFQLARLYLTDPLHSVDRTADVLEQRLSRGFTHVPEERRQAQRARALADYVSAVRELLAVLEGAGDGDLADEVRKRAVEAIGWSHVRDDVAARLASDAA